MWFIANTQTPPKFYNANGMAVIVEAIEWTTTVVDNNGNIIGQCSPPIIQNNQQAIHALYESGIGGFSVKAKAKAFAQKIELKTWKYINLK
jgi:predicted transcriptional regulator YheO